MNGLEAALSKLADSMARLSAVSRDPSIWAMDELGLDLYDNQIDIVTGICDLSVKYLAILQSRGAGKSIGVCVGILKLCLDIPGIHIGVFGPTTPQATRLISDIRTSILKPDSPVWKQVNWELTTNSRVVFTNGSRIQALSASETAKKDGWHFSVLVVDEAADIADIVFQRLLIPMLAGSVINKIIKLGVAKYNNHFKKSCDDPGTQYKVLKRPWHACPILLLSGSIMYEGKEYPKFIVEQAPLSVKKKYFPKRTDLHYESVNNLSEIDFNTQYEMRWESDLNLLLSEEDQLLLASGSHELLQRGMKETYVFGLDTAPSSILPGKKGLDYTALSIWRVTNDRVKQLVAEFEWQGDIIAQAEEIRQIIDPKTGWFPCAFGFADYSNIAISLVENFKKDGVPIEGIVFGARDPVSGKNYKNAMADQFVYELRNNRVQFPSLDHLQASPVAMKAFNELCIIEKKYTGGVNSQIQAPSGSHDDHAVAAWMAILAADRLAQSGKQKLDSSLDIPTGLGNFSLGGFHNGGSSSGLPSRLK